ncbi:MAG TPA: helix-turn-helix domain-containing protein [Candidatus Binataceae bacterium]|nr:helix-turn-helix domain-containing protein [Candidatus Binataceae bacterium]
MLRVAVEVPGNASTTTLSTINIALGRSVVMEHDKTVNQKLGWTLDELANSLGVSVPFLRLEIKRGKLRAAHLGRRIVLLDAEVRRYLAEASDRAA